MRPVKHLVPLVLVTLLLAGCEAPRPVATPTAVVVLSATASPTIVATPTATPMATAMPSPSATPRAVWLYAWQQPPATKVAHVDAIVQAVVLKDVAALARYVVGTMSTVGCGPSTFLCPPGVSLGTRIPLLSTGGVGSGGGDRCVGGGDFLALVPAPPPPPPPARDWVTPSALAAELLARPMYLRDVVIGSSLNDRASYELVFQYDLHDPDMGQSLLVDSRGIIGLRGWNGRACVPDIGGSLGPAPQPSSTPAARTPTPATPR